MVNLFNYHRDKRLVFSNENSDARYGRTSIACGPPPRISPAGENGAS